MIISRDHIKDIFYSAKMCLIIPFAFLLKKRYRNVWLISERSHLARDNGYVLFKYIREKHPGDPVFYLSDQCSKDYDKIKDLGNIIKFDSIRHFFYFCISSVHISSHVRGCCPSHAYICRYLKRFLKYHDVFVPHGVSVRIAEFCLKKHADMDLFICSGKPEYDNVLKNYGYAPEEVVYTGFPRLDLLHDCDVNSKQIVLMPTWRAYLAQDPNMVFEETKYFHSYQNLLTDPALASFLIKNHLRLVFYIHHAMKKYAGFFKTQCSNIEIVYDYEKYDIQDLLKSSALLITDYSSVYFDFAYMNKPVIYFQFDRDEFYNRQYTPSSFNEKTNGFGPVVEDRNSLLEALSLALMQRFQVPEEYHKNMLAFYQLHDTDNCQRVYRIIKTNFDEGE